MENKEKFRTAKEDKKKLQVRVLTAVMVLILLFSYSITDSHAENRHFIPNPITGYAREFIKLSENQQWFLDEIEKLLNIRQKSINSIEGREDLKYIKSIGMSNKGITGNIPKAIGELTELQHLFLSDNLLSGNIPSELFTLSKLETVDLGNNRFRLKLPVGFANMPKLESLILKNNEFYGTIPSEITNNKNIKNLNLSKNKLTGGIPAEIANMKNLESLVLSQNPLEGEIPDLNKLSNLKVLSLWENELTGEIHDSVYGLVNLQILDISDNGLSGEIKDTIGNLKKLELLSVACNKISGKIPENLNELLSIRKIDLSNNKLRGTVPDVFNSSKIKEINLSNNYLRGIMPGSIKMRIADSAKINLNNNYMTGEDLNLANSSEDNFCDQKADDYQLTSLSENITVSKVTPINIYNMLKNRHEISGDVINKVLLRPDEYKFEILSGDPAKIEISTDAKGIYILAKDDILLNDKIAVKISIKDNDNTNNSKTTIYVSTEKEQSAAIMGNTDEKENKKMKRFPYINGYTDNTFRKDKNVTREEVCKMIIKGLGIKIRDYKFTTFKDVPKNRWSYSFVEEAKEREYVKGVSNNMFAPDRQITRAELACVLSRISEILGKSAEQAEISFYDLKSGSWYEREVIQAIRYGLIKGYPDKSFRPDKKVTRLEAVIMINRALGRNPEDIEDREKLVMKFADMDKSEYGFYEVLEAAIEHYSFDRK